MYKCRSENERMPYENFQISLLGLLRFIQFEVETIGINDREFFLEVGNKRKMH